MGKKRNSRTKTQLPTECRGLTKKKKSPGLELTLALRPAPEGETVW